MALAGPPDVERYREALADCVEETDRVLVMLETLMDISEAESGAMPLQRETAAAGRHRGAGRSISIARSPNRKASRSTSASTGAVTVIGDRVRLEQVAANLLDNAIKYTPSGGHVAIVGRRRRPVRRCCA